MVLALHKYENESRISNEFCKSDVGNSVCSSETMSHKWVIIVIIKELTFMCFLKHA